MADKPGFNVASGFNGGVTVGINADSWQEFVTLCEQAFPGEGVAVAQGLYLNLRNQAGLMPLPTEGQAVGMIQQQMGGQVIPQQSGPPSQADQQWAAAQYGQPQWQQQQFQPQPPQYQQPAAQNGPPPGQTHDPKDPTKTKWVPAGVSQKSGKAYIGFWAKP